MSLQYEMFSQDVREAYTRDQVEIMQEFGYGIEEIEANGRGFMNQRRRQPQALLLDARAGPTTFDGGPVNNVNTGYNYQFGPFNYGNNNGALSTMVSPQVNNRHFPQASPPFVADLNGHYFYGQPPPKMPILDQSAPMIYQQPSLAGGQQSTITPTSYNSQGMRLFGTPWGSSLGTNLSGQSWQSSFENMGLPNQHASGYQTFNTASQGVATQMTLSSGPIDPNMSQDTFGIDPQLTLINRPAPPAEQEPQYEDIFNLEEYLKDAE